MNRLLVSLLCVWHFSSLTCCGDERVDRRSVEAIRHPDNLQLSLWADSTQLANPVAFSFDDEGRMYVCETFRQSKGVEDNRGHMDWLDDDLAAQSVEDRLEYFKKHLNNDLSAYEAHEDRVTIVADENGDGRADRAWVFADGFRDALDGTGAGVLIVDGDVYYSCIPKLWRLKDTDGDEMSDQRDALHHGYGVRVAFRGHDLHGLTRGMDGRIYFSIGDRGYNIRTEDGRQLKDPESGAVFRCELDGSGLEVFATGLRNPQELAFDDAGNLFTGDNNSDSGDQARWVHLVEGSDAGWRMSFQYLPDRGPWNREKLWHPRHEGQPAFIVPPIVNFADGPSGLTYYPGTGLDNSYRGTFFLCDFRGDAAMSGVRSFKMKAHGASFQMSEPNQFLWNLLATDIDFGPDGAIYATDWIQGWNGLDRGRVVRITDPKHSGTKKVRNVQRLLARDMSQDPASALLRRMNSADRRVRMKAQFELARRGDTAPLTQLLAMPKRNRARTHAAWALGHIARTGVASTRAEAALIPLVKDRQIRVRAAAVNSLGDIRSAKAAIPLIAALHDAHPRIRAFAAIALGKIGDTTSYYPLLELIAKNDNADPVVRHAGVMGLAGVATSEQLANLASHERPSVRLAAVLALRRLGSPAVAKFLNDDEFEIVAEAARAIHDVPIMPAMDRLASIISRPLAGDALLRRVLNANYRGGTPEHARRLGAFAARTDAPAAMRVEAIEMLAAWATPSNRDRVLGMWRPLEARSQDPAAEVVREVLPHMSLAPPEVSVAAARVAANLGIAEAATMLQTMIADVRLPAENRAELLRALNELKYEGTSEVVKQALRDATPQVRNVARDLLADQDPQAALALLVEATRSDAAMERQAAYATLGRINVDGVDAVLTEAAEQLSRDELPADTRLDVVTAIQLNETKAATDILQKYLSALDQQPMGRHRLAMEGGSASRGEQLFQTRTSLSCLRCHRVGKDGGRVGPNLAGIGKSKTREYLLESIVAPNEKIAEGFGTVVLVTEDGEQKQGIVEKDMEDMIHMVDADGNRFFVMKDEILDQQNGKSAMPEDLVKFLNPFELRDLVAYLTSLQTPWNEETQEHE